MADVLRVCVFLYFLYNFCAALVTKEFFCQDPDTEELHHVNTTWSSTRFCGNYTCKVKKRLAADMDTQPSSLNNVLINPYDNNKGSYSEGNQKAELSITTKRELPEETTRNILQTDITSDFTPKRATDKDRYLNDAEIKSISELLHTIKKSDIDAIVEVYNLAQDIYKEMETETMNDKHEVRFNKMKFSERIKPSSKTSYWYDPLYHTDYTFDRIKDITLREQVDPVPTAVATNFYPIYSIPYTEKVTLPYSVQRKPVPSIPYYYPLPVQNMAVKKKFPPVQAVLRNQYVGPDVTPPCPWSNKVLKKQYSYYPYPKPMEAVAKLLPLPFSYFNNYDHYFPKLYRQNWNMTRQNQQTPYTKMEVVQQKPVIPEPKTLLTGLPDKTYSQTVTQSSNLDILNEALENDISRQNYIRASKDTKPIKDTLSKSLREKQEKLAPWQTLPLSQKILDEVKANILENTENLLKPFTLKKKLRLARVAKVLKLDDLERKRREIVEVTRGDVLEENDFEVYLEKITCEVSTDPGLFSLGDLSLPFPACCPQKLNTGGESTATSSQKPTGSTTSDSLGLNALETNSECTENGTSTVPFSAFSSDVSDPYSLQTELSPSPSAETLKLTTNSLGISTLTSSLDVVPSTLKTSSSTPQTTTSVLPPTPTVNSKTTPTDLSIPELSILPSNSSKLPELSSLPTESLDVSELSMFPSKSSKLEPDLSIKASESPKIPDLSDLPSSEIPELSIIPSISSKEPQLSVLKSTTSKVPAKSSSKSSTAISKALGVLSKLSTLPIDGTTLPSTTESTTTDLTTITTESSSSTKKSFKSNKYSHLKF